MKKIILSCLLAYASGAFAQVGPPQATNPNTNNGYGFTQSDGVYTPLSASKTIWQSGSALGTDAVSGAISLPFTFKYNGRSYTSLYINNNGYITFGNPSSATSTIVLNSEPFTVATYYTGAIAGFAANLQNANTTTSEIAYETVGSKFILQFTDVKAFSGSPTQNLNFQIQLDSSNNAVSIVYGACVGGSVAVNGQVGLKGGETSDVNNRMTISTAIDWTATTPGIDNGNGTGYCTIGTTGGITVPQSGLTFTFTPGTWLATPTTYATLPFTESFSSWVNGNSTADLPNATYWRSWPSRGDNSWRASDMLTSGYTTASGWTTATSVAGSIVSPAVAPTARFHSSNTVTATPGYMDLYVDLSGGGAGNRVIAFDYLNVSGSDKLDIQLSTDGGTTFNNIGPSIGIAVTWTNKAVTTTSASPSAIIRFLATGDNGANDILVDNLTITTSTLPPACATVTSPANATTGVSLTPTITWGTASGALSYTINIGTTPGGTNIMNGVNVGNVVSYTIPAGTPLSYSVQYYVTIIPVNGYGSAAGCTESTFTTLNIACPTVTGPPVGLTGTSVTPTVTWNAITGATGYKISMGTTPGGVDAMNNVDVGNVTSYTLSAPLLSGTKYYYRVNAYSATSTSAGCTERNFITACQPTVPAITSTTGGNVSCTGSTTLSATADTGAVLNWYDTATGGTKLGTGNTYTTPVITSTTNYYVEAANMTTYPGMGKAAPVISGSTSTTSTPNSAGTGLVFNANQPFTINSVDVYLVDTAAGNLLVKLLNSAGTEITNTTVSVPVGNAGTPVIFTVPLNFNVPVGTGYRLVTTSGTSMVREYSGLTYPYNFGTCAGDITSGFFAGNPSASAYGYFYNWNITTKIASARTMVTATVISCLGTSETADKKNDINVYPNPFTEVLNISEVSAIKSISITDTAGRLVKNIETPSAVLHLEGLNTGMYLILFNKKDGSKQSIKIIKQ